jgi:hypothetical protein
VRRVDRDDRHADQRPPVQVQVTRLGSADLVPALELATIGRTTDRFSFNECTSPSSRSSATTRRTPSLPRKSTDNEPGP